MHLLKKFFSSTAFALLSASAPTAIVFAQNLANTENTASTAPIPEERRALDLFKLQESYDHSAKYAVNCTIYALDYRLISITVTVLSTYKVSACDPDLFAATTSASVKAQLAAYQAIDRVIPIGPHVQMMDRNTSTVSKPYLSIGILNFSPIATSFIGPLDIITNIHNWMKLKDRTTTYSPIHMSENVNYVWLPGSEIYTLTSNKGELFVMSHFTPDGSGIKVTGIDDGARELGQFLNLPKGWRYEVKTLKKILAVKRFDDVGQTTRRVFDEYSNAYIAIDRKIE